MIPNIEDNKAVYNLLEKAGDGLEVANELDHTSELPNIKKDSEMIKVMDQLIEQLKLEKEDLEWAYNALVEKERTDREKAIKIM